MGGFVIILKDCAQASCRATHLKLQKTALPRRFLSVFPFPLSCVTIKPRT
jgi:hypothetical protein